MHKPLKQASLLFLVKDASILLAMKKRGFGAGHWNGVGGKPEANEPIEKTAIRECQEEIGVTPNDFHRVAVLDFSFPKDKVSWNQQVIVYLCNSWEGEPKETEEMKPQWFEASSIPYDKMWKDDIYWLPEVLNGNYVEASFDFDADENIAHHSVMAKPLPTSE